MKIKYEEAMQGSVTHCYPSQEHYRKLVVLTDDLHLERYYSEDAVFKKLHELHLLLRNFNIESEVALDHITNVDLPMESKLRDFNGLNLKCEIVIGCLTEIVGEMWKNEDSVKNTLDIIQKYHDGSIHKRKDAPIVSDEVARMIEARVEQELRSSKILTTLADDTNREHYKAIMLADLMEQCSSLPEGSILPEKIHIIRSN